MASKNKNDQVNHLDYWYRVQKDGGQTKLDM